MVDHGQRAHATWSASATARNWHCPGALTMSLYAPDDKESIHAARGTAAHQIAEKCLRGGMDASDFLDTVEKTKEHDITIDEELANSAQEYVDYCRELGSKAGAHQSWVEERFDLSALGTPFDAGGTGDFVHYAPHDRALEIVDLKNGTGVVDVKENPQLRTYALGALLHHQDLDVDTVTVTIVQPRAPHKDGRIRSETFHVGDLAAWTAELLKAMGRSKTALDAYKIATGNSVLMDEWVDTWLRPGKCKFCPAEGTCPALRKQALAVAETWVDEADQPRIGNLPNEMSPEKLAHTLDMLPMLEDWIKAVRAFAHAQADSGVEIPGYHLAEKIGNRKWKGDDAAVVSALSSDAGLTEDDIYERKVRSVAQIEKVLGAKRKHLVADMWERPVTGVNLVSAEKTTRPAVRPSVEDYLEPTK